MLHRLLTAMALVYCAVAVPSQAHPLYPGLAGKSSVERSAKAEGWGGGNAKAIAVAQRELGTNPTGWRRLWCAVWLNRIEKKLGRRGTGSAIAKSFVNYGKRVPLAAAKPGDIVVTGRKGGGHVGYLVKKQGKAVTLISGNSGGRGPGRRVVAQGSYPVSRIIAVVRPS